jgi:cyclohexa-1,5-dienecarbonyl-CoA hydratase
MGYDTIRFLPGPGVSKIVLDRPPLNVLNLAMMAELDRAWNELDDLESPVVIISGHGEKSFSAGVDIADHTPDRVGEMLEKFHGTICRIYDSDRISIAAIHGHTLGGAAELAMACDFVIAADDLELAHPEIDVGCYPPVAAALLPSMVGMHRASQLVLLGDTISADQAMAMGLVNSVAPRQDLDGAADKLADRLLSKSAAVLSVAKKALRAGAGNTFADRLKRIERLYMDQLARTEDMKEGVDAFMEKRSAVWKNR